MNSKYYNKYLKYKNKYNNLKIQNMNASEEDDYLTNYWIASTHNTYLSGNQLTGVADINCYTNFIRKFKGGCVELDTIDISGDGDDINVYHIMTYTGVLSLRAILIALKQTIIKIGDKMTGPVILSFDNFVKNYDLIWAIIFESLRIVPSDLNQHTNLIDTKFTVGDSLLYNPKQDYNKIKLKDCKGKFIIKWGECNYLKECPVPPCNCGTSITSPNQKYNFMSEHNYIHIAKGLNEYNIWSYESGRITIGQRKILIKYPTPTDIDLTFLWTYCKDHYIRIYPKGINIASGNFPIIPYLIHGVQMVALNIQKQDLYTMTLCEIFKNSCMIKKPVSLKDSFHPRITINSINCPSYNITQIIGPNDIHYTRFPIIIENLNLLFPIFYIELEKIELIELSEVAEVAEVAELAELADFTGTFTLPIIDGKHSIKINAYKNDNILNCNWFANESISINCDIILQL